MQDLVDMHIFAEAHAILEGLAAQDCSAALQWCSQHRARLRKIRSKLEFRLRIQVGPSHIHPSSNKSAHDPWCDICCPKQHTYSIKRVQFLSSLRGHLCLLRV